MYILELYITQPTNSHSLCVFDFSLEVQVVLVPRGTDVNGTRRDKDFEEFDRRWPVHTHT